MRVGGARHAPSRRWSRALRGLALAACLLAGGCGSRSSTGTAVPAVEKAYVWQRVWTRDVRRSVAEHAAAFDALQVLAAEASWHDGRMHLQRFEPDRALLPGRVSLVLRIGRTPDGGAPSGADGVALLDAAAVMARDLAPVEELQVDFDATERALPAYGTWLDALTARVAPARVTVTALPSWLDSPAFAALAQAHPMYTLQVHALTRVPGRRAWTVFDEPSAERALAKASALGVPFLVALPTHGWGLSVDSSGAVDGVAAEQAPDWRAPAPGQEVRASPADVAAFVRHVRAAPPPAWRGFAWFRLPVESDVRNWSWGTLAAVRDGHTPAADVRVAVVRSEPLVADLVVENAGDDEAAMPARVEVDVSPASLARDGLGGYGWTDARTLACRSSGHPLRPGERRPVGWLRLASPLVEVHAHAVSD